MPNLFQEKYKKYCVYLYLIIFMILFRIGFYIYIIVASVGKVTFIQYISIAITLLMYLSIGKYIFDYFKFGKNASLESILIRYAAALAATLINTQGQNKPVLIMMLILIVLAPYLAGSIKRGNFKKNVIISSLILAISIAIAITSSVNPNQPDIYGLGNKIPVVLDSINIAIEWIMIFALGLIRGFAMKEEMKIQATSEKPKKVSNSKNKHK